MLALVGQCFLDEICSCDAMDDIAFTTVMAAKGGKVVLTTHALFYTSDPLFIRISYEVILEGMMDLPCVSLEVSAT